MQYGMMRAQRTSCLNTDDSWMYEDGQDEVVFSVGKACQLLGIGLCGTEGAYTAEVELLEVSMHIRRTYILLAQPCIHLAQPKQLAGFCTTFPCRAHQSCLVKLMPGVPTYSVNLCHAAATQCDQLCQLSGVLPAFTTNQVARTQPIVPVAGGPSRRVATGRQDTRCSPELH